MAVDGNIVYSNFVVGDDDTRTPLELIRAAIASHTTYPVYIPVPITPQFNTTTTVLSYTDNTPVDIGADYWKFAFVPYEGYDFTGGPFIRLDLTLTGGRVVGVYGKNINQSIWSYIGSNGVVTGGVPFPGTSNEAYYYNGTSAVSIGGIPNFMLSATTNLGTRNRWIGRVPCAFGSGDDLTWGRAFLRPTIDPTGSETIWAYSTSTTSATMSNALTNVFGPLSSCADNYANSFGDRVTRTLQVWKVKEPDSDVYIKEFAGRITMSWPTIDYTTWDPYWYVNPYYNMGDGRLTTSALDDGVLEWGWWVPNAYRSIVHSSSGPIFKTDTSTVPVPNEWFTNVSGGYTYFTMETVSDAISGSAQRSYEYALTNGGDTYIGAHSMKQRVSGYNRQTVGATLSIHDFDTHAVLGSSGYQPLPSGQTRRRSTTDYDITMYIGVSPTGEVNPYAGYGTTLTYSTTYYDGLTAFRWNATYIDSYGMTYSQAKSRGFVHDSYGNPSAPVFSPDGINIIDGSGSIPGEDDPNNPGGTSGPGGGDGNFDNQTDLIGDPDKPVISAIDSGVVSLLVPNQAELKSLSNYLWSSAFSVDSFKKLFANPMDVIISLHILPVDIPQGSTVTVKVGGISTSVSMHKASEQYVKWNSGNLDLKEYWGSALDYSPNTKLFCYLPYVGAVPIDPDLLMKKALSISYTIDAVTGAFAARILADDSVVYHYTGNCAVQLPLSASDYARLYGSIIGAAGAVALAAAGGAAAIGATSAMGAAGAARLGGAASALSGAGAATSSALSGLASRSVAGSMLAGRNGGMGPLATAAFANANYAQDALEEAIGGVQAAIPGALNEARQSGLKAYHAQAAAAATGVRAVNNVTEAVMSAKPSIAISGAPSGSAGILDNQQPYLIIIRPRQSLAENYKHYVGYPSNMTAKVSTLTGFTSFEQIELKGVPATDGELAEIIDLMKGGVYL